MREPLPPLDASIAAADPALLRDASDEGQRLRLDLLEGRTVAFVGVGYEQKRGIYERARALGLVLVLLDHESHWSMQLVEEGIAAAFLPFDVTAPVDAQADEVVAALRAHPHPVESVTTFWENSVAVAARVAAALGLPGNPPEAVDRARSKRLTRIVSAEAGLPGPRSCRVETPIDLEAAAAEVGFPAVIKPEHGTAAIGALRVDSLAELREAFAMIAPRLTVETDDAFASGSALVLEHYLDGAEFDVDLLLDDGECVFASVADNWPTLEPSLGETGLHAPSLASPDVQRGIVDLAARTVEALGLRRGAMHVEAKHTSDGPRILEVNARMGGGTVDEMVRRVHGVDLVREHLLTSAGIPIRPRRAAAPLVGAVEVTVRADRTGTLAHTGFVDALRATEGVIQVALEVAAGGPLAGPETGFPTAIAEFVVVDVDAPAAIARANAIVDRLALPYA